jgi:SSS family solute:Na+ symporter
MFLLAFLSRRANRQGLWIGIIANLLFTSWAVLTSGKHQTLDLGDYNFTWPSVMIGVIGHVIVLVIGYLASFAFPPEAGVKREWTLWGWLEMRRALRGEKTVPPAVMEAGL